MIYMPHILIIIVIPIYVYSYYLYISRTLVFFFFCAGGTGVSLKKFRVPCVICASFAAYK